MARCIFHKEYQGSVGEKRELNAGKKCIMVAQTQSRLLVMTFSLVRQVLLLDRR